MFLSWYKKDIFYFYGIKSPFQKKNTSEERYNNNSIFEKRLVRAGVTTVTTVRPELVCCCTAGPVSHMTVIARHLSRVTKNGNDGNDSARFKSAPQRRGCS